MKPKSTVRELVGMSLAMLLGLGGVMSGSPPMWAVFALTTAAGASLAFAAYWGGRLDSAREFQADLSAALPPSEDPTHE